MLSMKNIAAQRQLYFIDACRKTIDDAELKAAGYTDNYGMPRLSLLGTGVSAPVIRYPKRAKRARVLPIFSTRPTEPANELPNQTSTVFSKALLRSLTSCAARKRDGSWDVMPDSLCSQTRNWTSKIAKDVLHKSQEADCHPSEFDTENPLNQLTTPPRSWLSVNARKRFADLEVLRLEADRETPAVERSGVDAAAVNCMVKVGFYKITTYEAAHHEISHKWESLLDAGSFSKRVEL